MSFPPALSQGRYLLVDPLGEGGMATVYRAYDQRLQVWRAIKILSPDFSTKPKLRARFEGEARTMALLEHRNIVRVYDVGVEGPFVYIVMEIVEGGALVDWLVTNGAMPERMAVEVMLQLCEGVSFAHHKGVVHRDLKPHNVLITPDGACRITDFGIAQVSHGQQSMTQTGAVMGTWAYMAPEQRTDSKNVDGRADVYSLAATLYALVADRTPMDLFAVEPDGPQMAGIDPVLVEIILAGTEYRPEDRIQSVEELAELLAEALPELAANPPDTPPLAKPAGPPREPPEPVVAYHGSSANLGRFDQVGNTIAPAQSLPPGSLPAGGLHGVGVTLAPTPTPHTRADRSVPPHHLHGTLPSREESTLPPDLGEGRGSGVAIAVAGMGVFTLVGLGLAAALVGVLYLDVLGLFTAPAIPDLAADTQVEPDVPDEPDTATPKPDAVVDAVPDPVPTTVKPVPTTVKPVPTTVKPVPTAVTSTPDPVPVSPTPNPTTVVVTKVPDPVPPPPVDPGQCIKGSPPPATGVGSDAVFKAKLCVDDGRTVTLWYRPKGGNGYDSLLMPQVLGSRTTKVPVTERFRVGIEYYVDAGSVTDGTALRPLSVKVY